MLSFWWKKKGNFQTRRDISRREVRGGFAAALLFFCMLLAWFFFPTPFTYLGIQIIRPFAAVAHWYTTSANAVPTYFRGIDALRAERDTLRTERDASLSLREERAYLESVNSALRGMLPADTDDDAGIVAGVIAAPPQIPYDTLLIDKGSRDGIAEGTVVYRDSLYAVGVVHTVFETYALVQLFSSPQATTIVYTPEGRLFAKAEGVGNGVVRVRVPQDVPISVGTAVVLPGIDGSILGFIRVIQAEPTSPEKSAFITMRVPLSYQFVRVARTPRPSISFEEAERVVRERTIDMGFMTLPAEYIKETNHATSTATTTQPE